MPYINLIQEQRLVAKKNEQKTRLFFMSFAATAVLCTGAFGFLMFQTEALQGEESALKAKAQKMQPLVRQIEEQEAEFQKLAPRLQTLEDAQLMTGKWDAILNHLTTQTPEQTWLTALRTTGNDPKSPIGITFAGLTTRQELVGEFILRLQGCPELQGVDLNYTQEKAVENRSNIEFEIKSTIGGSEDEKERNELKKEEKA